MSAISTNTFSGGIPRRIVCMYYTCMKLVCNVNEGKKSCSRFLHAITYK